MTSRYLPTSTARRIKSVTPVIKASSSAQFGQQLVANRRAAQTYADIYAGAVRQGYGGSSPANLGGQPTTIGGGVVINPSMDPRMGYPESWSTIGGGAAGVPPYTGPVVNTEPAYTIGGGAVTLPPPPVETGGGGSLPGGFRPGEGYSGTAGLWGEFNRREREESARTQELMERAIAQLQAEAFALEQKRQQALAAAEGDIAKAYGDQIAQITEQIGGLQGDLERYRLESAETIAANQKGFEQAVGAAGTITSEGLPMVEADSRFANQQIVEGYDEAMVGLAEELMGLNIDSESMGVLASDVLELRALALEESDLTSENAKQMLQSAQDVARTAAELAGITDEKELKEIEEAWSKQLTDSITGLMKQRGQLEQAREDAIRKARESINAQFEEYGQYGSGLEYAEDVTDKAMDVWFASSGLDELQRQEAESAFQQLVNMGLRTPAEMKAYFDSLIEEGSMPPGAGVQEAIFTMADIFFEALGSWSTESAAAIPNQDVTGGKLSQTGDRIKYVRSGEAPNNIANRNQPAYRQRAQFMTEMKGYITQAFNVTSAGQWRDVSAAGGGQRSRNSDHYSGGALDFSGSREEIDRLFNWLKTQPWVSFAQIYTSGPAAGTLHVSGLLDGQTHHANDGHNHGQAGESFTRKPSGDGRSGTAI
jgi:hypothetical protein